MNFIISIIGNYNVGKSTLFNILSNKNNKEFINNSSNDIIFDYYFLNKKIIISDTYSLNFDKNNILNEKLFKNINILIDNSNIILLLVDINILYNKINLDEKVINFLNNKKKNILLLINKIDLIKNYNIYLDKKKLYNLKLYNFFFVSLKNNVGINNILFYIKKNIYNNILNNKKYIEKIKNFILIKKHNKKKIIIVGKTNSGKSTLLNTLVNYNRMLVCDINNTTLNIISTENKKNNTIITDTYGIRYKNKKTNKFNNIINNIYKHNVILYLTSYYEFDNNDLNMINLFIKNNKFVPIIIVINKIDLIKSNKEKIFIKNNILNKLSFIKNKINIIFISALNKIKINKLLFYIKNININMFYKKNIINIKNNIINYIKKYNLYIKNKKINFKIYNLYIKNNILNIIINNKKNINENFKKFIINNLNKKFNKGYILKINYKLY